MPQPTGVESTRRDDVAAATRRDPPVSSPGPGPTRRDQPAGATRRDSPVPDAGTPLVRLPSALTGRFTAVAEIRSQGVEADLVQVRDPDGENQVVKIFRRGFAADRQVWEKLRSTPSPHIVRITETGHSDGRDYEVMEYVANGNLRTLAESGRITPVEAVVTELVRQLVGALSWLHSHGIVHRDLKPDNILVRNIHPLSLAVTDFGLSKAIDESVVFASHSRTLAYAAPESLSGQVSPARDWWSLGMITLELATGRGPFAGMTETAVLDHLATRTVDTRQLSDPRFRLLCRGLLIRDPRRRWGAEEVRLWLDGGSPPVPEDRVEPPRPRPTGLPFRGGVYTTREDLAAALAEHWAAAAQTFFAGMKALTGPTEAWYALRLWLQQFDDASHDGAERRMELVDTRLLGDEPPDVKLLHLIRWLDPALPPCYLGLRMTRRDLPGLAAWAEDPAHPEHARAVAVGQALWRHRLLGELAGFAGGEDLPELHDRWADLVRQWNAHTDRWRGTVAGAGERLPLAGGPGDDSAAILLTLLSLAADPDGTGASLARAAAEAPARLVRPVPWFDDMVALAWGDPFHQLALVRVLPLAVAEAENAERRDRETRERENRRRQAWSDRERRRRRAAPLAGLRALLVTLPFLPLWVGGTLVAGYLHRWAVGDAHDWVRDTTAGFGVMDYLEPLYRFSGDLVGSNLLAAAPLLAAVAWMPQFMIEATAALLKGRDYTLAEGLRWPGRTLDFLGRGLRTAFGGFWSAAFSVAALAFLILPALPLLWLLLVGQTVAGQLVTTLAGLIRWKKRHDDDRRIALEDDCAAQWKRGWSPRPAWPWWPRWPARSWSARFSPGVSARGSPRPAPRWRRPRDDRRPRPRRPGRTSRPCTRCWTATPGSA
ncbi:protein kinase domain-containing protein [Acrocarpospora phusangensis]|nr:serine/threonine-protein kinase [Acrocarpospora phusangensis]